MNAFTVGWNAYINKSMTEAVSSPYSGCCDYERYIQWGRGYTAAIRAVWRILRCPPHQAYCGDVVAAKAQVGLLQS